MKRVLPLLLVLIISAACTKEKLMNACVVPNPMEDVVWLKKKVSELEKSPYCHSIRRFNFQGHTVFVVGTCEPNFNSVDQIYDCEGNYICGWGDQQCPGFEREAIFEKLLWRSK